jgi:cysteine desulfuration protein SufE
MTLEKLISNFELLGDWEERYGYLIDLGKKLPGLPDAEKNEDNRVHGCQAMVWMIMEPDPEHPGALRFRADSDAFIVRGLIAVLQLIFNGRTPDEILKADAKSTLSQLGLDKHLSPTRKNGLFAMVERIRTLARESDASGLKGRHVTAQAEASTASGGLGIDVNKGESPERA